MIVFGLQHLHNPECDTLYNRLGIALCMVVAGASCLGMLLCVPATILCCLNRQCFRVSRQSQMTPLAVGIVGISCGLVQVGWFVYGCVVTFVYNPGETLCPWQVHAFSYYALLAFCGLAVMICIWIACLMKSREGATLA